MVVVMAMAVAAVVAVAVGMFVSSTGGTVLWWFDDPAGEEGQAVAGVGEDFGGEDGHGWSQHNNTTVQESQVKGEKEGRRPRGRRMSRDI